MNIRTVINKMLILNLVILLLTITSSACLDLMVSSPAYDSRDPLLVVTDFHSAVNSSDEDALLSLFADDAIVLDNGRVIDGVDDIRNWSKYSSQMSGLHLVLIKSEMEGDTLTWLDLAHHGPEIEPINYIVQWEAVLHEGRVQSLSVMPRYWPDLK